VDCKTFCFINKEIMKYMAMNYRGKNTGWFIMQLWEERCLKEEPSQKNQLKNTDYVMWNSPKHPQIWETVLSLPHRVATANRIWFHFRFGNEHGNCKISNL
jgi:hypothetical protein